MQALRLQLQSTRNHTFGRSLCGIDNDAIITLNNSPDKDQHSRRAQNRRQEMVMISATKMPLEEALTESKL